MRYIIRNELRVNRTSEIYLYIPSLVSTDQQQIQTIQQLYRNIQWKVTKLCIKMYRNYFTKTVKEMSVDNIKPVGISG